MRQIKKTILVAAGLVLALAQGGCLVGRQVSTSNVLDLPNTITARGFKYVKKGIVGRYDLHGIYPAKLNREQLMSALNVADEAYRRLWEAAGGIMDNQALVNVVVEVSFVQKNSELFMALGFYADKIELAPAPARAAAPGRQGALVQLIRDQPTRAARAQLPGLL